MSRIVGNEKMDPMTFLMYPQVMEQAKERTSAIPIPVVDDNNGFTNIQSTLRDLLGGAGLGVMGVHMTPTGGNTRVNIQMEEDPHDRIRDALNMHGESAFN
jgi:hypothetical protein